jgi:hypothetical protein
MNSSLDFIAWEIDRTESLEWIKEDHAFLRTYDSAPRPPPPPPPSGQQVDSQSSYVSPVSLMSDGRRGGKGAGEETSNTTERKPCPL